MNEEPCTSAQWAYIKKLRRQAGMTDGAKPRTKAKAHEVIERLLDKTKDIEPGSREPMTDAQYRLIKELSDGEIGQMPRSKLEASRRIEELNEAIAERMLIAEYTGASP